MTYNNINNNISNNTLNSNIRSLRLQKQLSHEKLGELLCVSAQAVSKWEQGITSPDISLLPLLAECFGVTIDGLFQGVPARKYPGYGEERHELLAIYRRKDGTDEDFDRAAQRYEELILKGRATVEDYVDYGVLHRVRASRDMEKALYYYRRAIAEGNDNRDLQWMAAHQTITNLLADMGRVEEAVAEQRKWCESEPDTAWAHVSYGYALERAGQIEEAWQEAEKALAIDPLDINVLINAGDLCAKLGRYEDAIAYWDKSYEVDTTQISCLFSKAEMFASIGEKEKAIKQYEGILEWLEAHGYNMELEGAYPRGRIEDLKKIK